MQISQNDFIYSEESEPHKKRTKEILSRYPEVRNLIGKNPFSFIIILFVVSFQIILSYLFSDSVWWLPIMAAFLIGAFANHCLFVLIHESAHNLIFKKKAANLLAGIIADIPNVVPSAISFRNYHLKHHSFQGVYELDADLASKWEAKFIGRTTFGKALWELLFPVFQALRTLRLKEIEFLSGWVVLNMAVVFAVDVAVIYFFGWVSFIYLVFSFGFSIGFHPLGARWIQEHFILKPPQETYSYYGILNIPALNVGYHNEHHDFPSIPWSRLPKLKASAPDFYDSLHFHKSWFKLWLRFLFDPNITLFTRMVRKNRGDMAVVREL